MKSRCLALPLALLTLGCLVKPIAADPPRPTNLRPDILYTHRGEFVQVGPMRPLTMNAHVDQFQYDPLGLEIAVVGSETQGDQTVHFVKTVDVRTGHELSRFSVTAPTEDQTTAISLLGWSMSGKYLLLQRFSPDPQESETARIEFLRWDLSTNPPITRTIDPETALPAELQSPDLEGSAYCYPSPDHHWLAFTQSIHTQKSDGKSGPDKNAYLIYDPERDTFQMLPLPPDVSMYSWADKNHLKFWQGTDKKQIDVVTGQISPIPDSSDADAPAVSKQYPDLTLDVEHRDLEDTKEQQGKLKSYIIWIRRTTFGKFPLGAASAGLMPDSFPSSPGAGNNDPQAAWSPTGKQVAFIANNDLNVTDLTAATDMLPNEKMAVGLKLSCAEEQALAASDLKQIGLGLIQYTQDDDEKFPTADGFIDKIYPYIKSMDVFQIGSQHFVYEQPADLELAKMDSPADTENGYMDLPCARVVLFADRHVKVFPK
ncbi:MAG: hypothetical protein ACRYFS_25350 [Janthinobacterium lividum]